MIISVDPGPEKSAYVLFNNGEIVEADKIPNTELLAMLRVEAAQGFETLSHCVIEQIRGFGINAGNETFDTVWWTGRFFEGFGAGRTTMVPRKTVVTHLTDNPRAGDKDVRQAICYRYGGEEKAIGRVCKSKKINAPGPLYGIASDQWSALAVALWYADIEAARKAGKL